MYIYVCIYLYTHICTHICVYIHICVHIFVHTYTKSIYINNIIIWLSVTSDYDWEASLLRTRENGRPYI